MPCSRFREAGASVFVQYLPGHSGDAATTVQQMRTHTIQARQEIVAIR
jgi:hypothetical protein